MPTSEDWSYAAGIIDGEGCISIGQSGGHYHASVSVTMRHPQVIDWLHTTFGGYRYSPEPTKNKTCDERWELRNLVCQSFLEGVRNYLKLKGKQAGFVLIYLQTIGYQGGGSKIVTPADRLLRDKIYLLVKKLNEKRSFDRISNASTE